MAGDLKKVTCDVDDGKKSAAGDSYHDDGACAAIVDGAR